MESFFGRLKVELVYAKNYQSIEEARSGIFSYVEIFYNRRRRHSANDGLSPIAFEKKPTAAKLLVFSDNLVGIERFELSTPATP